MTRRIRVFVGNTGGSIQLKIQEILVYKSRYITQLISKIHNSKDFGILAHDCVNRDNVGAQTNCVCRAWRMRTFTDYFVGRLTWYFKFKFNSKVKIYPILSLSMP